MICAALNRFFTSDLINLGLKPPAGSPELLNRRIKTTLQDPSMGY